MDKIYFAKVDAAKETIIPSKRDEDAGYDIYANFDDEQVIIPPHTTKMIPTNIATAFSSDYVFILKERGSTGSKGITQHCGIVDSGYRNEIFVPLGNSNNKPIVITKETNKNTLETLTDDYIVYPYTKAITQGLLVPLAKVKSQEIPYEELLKFKSERGTGMLGSSGK